MDRMGDTIWKFLGGVSAMSSLICFGLSSTYKMSFGKLGICGPIVYELIGAIMFYLIYFVKRIRVSERIQVVLQTILFFAAIGLMYVRPDKLLPGKSDALSIIWNGLFAFMSVCTSRKSELGFETVFFTPFFSLFLGQLLQIDWKLVPIALGFFSCALFLRHRSLSASPNGDRPQEVAPPNAVADIGDEESQSSPEQSLLRTSNQENNLEAHHPPSNDGVPEERILEVVWEDQQNNDQEETSSSSSFPTSQYSRRSSTSSQDTEESSENQYSSSLSFTSNQDPEDSFESQYFSLSSTSTNQHPEESYHTPSFPVEQELASSGNNQNGTMRRSAGAEVFLEEASGLRRRRRTWMTTGIQNIPSRVGATLGRWRWQVVPALFFFL